MQEDDETAEAMEDEPEEGSMAVVLHEVRDTTGDIYA